MRDRKQQQPESPRTIRSRRQPESRARARQAAAALFVAGLLLLGAPLIAQTVPASTAVPAQKPAVAHPGSHSAATRPGTQPAAETPARPTPPDWPANDQPQEASVVWDSHGLRIVASNSSMAQILKDVSAKTGATLEGMGKDERIFGSYGPGPARDVIAQLLDGSAYNVLMIGDQGQGTPRRIVLSARPTGTAAQTQPTGNSNPAASVNEEVEADQEPQPMTPQPPGTQPPSVPLHTPRQTLQEMQQRQLQQPGQQQQPQQQQNP